MSIIISIHRTSSWSTYTLSQEHVEELFNIVQVLANDDPGIDSVTY